MSPLALLVVADERGGRGTGAAGVIGCALRVAALADENGGRPATSDTLARASPLRCMARGSWLPLNCCYVAGLCPQRSLRSDAVRRGSPYGGNGDAMEVMFDRVAGLDIGKDSVTVCVRTPGPRGGRRSETRTFKTMFGSLRVMRDWLVEAGVTIAAMESTSTYWKYDCLEEQMTVWLLNAAHMKAIPGRKKRRT